MVVFSEPRVLVDKVLPEPGVLVNLEGIVGVLLVIFSALCFGNNLIFALSRFHLSHAKPPHETQSKERLHSFIFIGEPAYKR